jgi:hypothetical protein
MEQSGGKETVLLWEPSVDRHYLLKIVTKVSWEKAQLSKPEFQQFSVTFQGLKIVP